MVCCEMTAIAAENQVERTDWTPIGLAELAFLMLSLRPEGSSMQAQKQ